MRKNEEMNNQEDVTAEMKENSEQKKVNTAEKRVRFKIPKGRNEQDRADVCVCVNGVAYQIKRGVVNELPESVVEVLENAETQMDYAIQLQEDAKEQVVTSNN